MYSQRYLTQTYCWRVLRQVVEGVSVWVGWTACPGFADECWSKALRVPRRRLSRARPRSEVEQVVSMYSPFHRQTRKSRCCRTWCYQIVKHHLSVEARGTLNMQEYGGKLERLRGQGNGNRRKRHQRHLDPIFRVICESNKVKQAHAIDHLVET